VHEGDGFDLTLEGLPHHVAAVSALVLFLASKKNTHLYPRPGSSRKR